MRLNEIQKANIVTIIRTKIKITRSNIKVIRLNIKKVGKK
ncbi:hypothetical protein SAMN05421780_10994 [Flexibacter flexilis DSM 6793]|uniref:Uncharacterized protein n=1 Tax=Flexibacter flexilis DSM 6793 TaxID=927664 RepID=A0A1I1LR15_9BACT|nr:hypothetical protein SAMN05421780_10994 [Flexibacter flexilis DSM 6793]